MDWKFASQVESLSLFTRLGYVHNASHFLLPLSPSSSSASSQVVAGKKMLIIKLLRSLLNNHEGKKESLGAERRWGRFIKG